MLTFEQAGQAYAPLRQQWEAGALTAEQFQTAVAQLRVTDAAGAVWQMDAMTGQWLCWDGAQWVAPGAQPVTPPPPQPMPQPQALPAKSPWAQRVWDFISVSGSAILSAVWYWYTGLDNYAGADKRTCIAMLVIPIALIVFRGPIDRALLPLARFKRNIPRMVLLGAGMATPVLVANFVYQTGSTEYGYMFKTYVFSTLISYVILRQQGPAATPAYRAAGQI